MFDRVIAWLAILAAPLAACQTVPPAPTGPASLQVVPPSYYHVRPSAPRPGIPGRSAPKPGRTVVIDLEVPVASAEAGPPHVPRIENPAPRSPRQQDLIEQRLDQIQAEWRKTIEDLEKRRIIDRPGDVPPTPKAKAK